MKRAYYCCSLVGRFDNPPCQRGAVRHLHVQHVELLALQQTADLPQVGGQGNGHTIFVKADFDVARQRMQVGKVSALGLAHQIMHLVTLRSEPAAKDQHVLLHAIGFI
jgi:hypothetical protein